MKKLFLLLLPDGEMDGQERGGSQNDGRQNDALQKCGTAAIHQPDAAERIFSIGHRDCLQRSSEIADNNSNILYPIFSRLQRENLQIIRKFSKIF